MHGTLDLAGTQVSRKNVGCLRKDKDTLNMGPLMSGSPHIGAWKHSVKASAVSRLT